MRQPSRLEAEFARNWRCLAGGYPEPVAEYRFDPDRRWRFDFAWPEQRLAVELDGGIWMQGRHTRGRGHINDALKRNAAQLAGWRVLTYCRDDLDSRPIEVVQEVVRGLGGRA